jgi:hypothetical protein
MARIMLFIPKNPALCMFNSIVVIPNPNNPSGAGLAVVSFI